MTQSFVHKLLSQLAVLAGARALGAVCVLGVSIVITRSLGAEAMAHYSLYLATASIISVLLPLGFHAIASMIVAEYQANDQVKDQIAFIRYGQRLIVIMALLLVFLATGFVYFFAGSSDYDLATIALFASPSAIAMAYTYFHAGTLIGMQRQFAGQLPDMALRPVLLLAGFTVLITLDKDANVFKVLAISSAVIWIAAFVQWLPLNRATKKSSSQGAIKADFKERSNWWNLAPSWMVVTILWEYFVEVHVLIAGFLVSPAEVALLYICFRLRQLAGFGFSAIEAFLMPKIFAANARGDDNERQSLILTFNRLSFAYAFFGLIATVMIGPYVLSIFGDEFKSGQSIFVLLIGTLVIRAVFGPSHLILGMSRNPVLVSKILIIAFIISLIICFIGFQFDGVLAITIGYVVASAFTSIAMWVYAKQKSGINCAIWS